MKPDAVSFFTNFQEQALNEANTSSSDFLNSVFGIQGETSNPPDKTMQKLAEEGGMNKNQFDAAKKYIKKNFKGYELVEVKRDPDAKVVSLVIMNNKNVKLKIKYDCNNGCNLIEDLVKLREDANECGMKEEKFYNAIEYIQGQNKYKGLKIAKTRQDKESRVITFVLVDKNGQEKWWIRYVNGERTEEIDKTKPEQTQNTAQTSQSQKVTQSQQQKNTPAKRNNSSGNGKKLYTVPYNDYWTLVNKLCPDIKYFNYVLKAIAEKNDLKINPKDSNGYLSINGNFKSKLFLPESIRVNGAEIKLNIPANWKSVEMPDREEVIENIHKSIGKKQELDFTLDDMKTLQKRLQTSPIDGVSRISINDTVGEVKFILYDGSNIEYNLEPAILINPKYKKGIESLVAAGYSEDLIINIINNEKFTSTPKQKVESGRTLWEYGFGHTSDKKPTRAITIDYAFTLLKGDLEKSENYIREKFGNYYNYDKLPQSLKNEILDVFYNRGEAVLIPREYNKDGKLIRGARFDKNYADVHDAIIKGDYGTAAVKLRQEKFNDPEVVPGLMKRNVIRFLMGIKDLKAKDRLKAMDLFNNTTNNQPNRNGYYGITLSKQSAEEARRLKARWDYEYNKAKKEAGLS